MSTQTLTPSEETLLASLVAQYREADTAETAANAQLKQAWRQKGAALIEINESRLYRQTHETFEAFAKAEFGLSRERAYQLMKAEEGALMAQAVGMVMQNESQARALADVPADKQADVLNIVHAKQEAGEKITAQTIQQAGESVTSTATEPQPNVKKVSQQIERGLKTAVARISDAICEDAGADFIGIADDVELLFIEVETHVLEKHPERTERLRSILMKMLRKTDGEKIALFDLKNFKDPSRVKAVFSELQPTH